MKTPHSLLWPALFLVAATAHTQPSFTAPAPVPAVVEDAAARRAGYLARRDEVVKWRAGLVKPDQPATFSLPEIAAKLALRDGVSPAQIDVRKLQTELRAKGAYLREREQAAVG